MYPSYKVWSPNSVNRTDLRCPSDCYKKHPDDVHHCCVCRAIPEWRLSYNYTLLALEYTNRDGSAIVIGDKHNFLPDILNHRDGYLQRLPTNLCDFTNIREIDLKRNKISTIGDISCLSKLDKLDLSYNKISEIYNDTFSTLTHLRILTLTHNGLTKLDPFSVAGTSLSIGHLDCSWNNLTEIDISNIIPENDFCEYKFTSNKITQIVNNGGFTLNLDKIYEGGLVELTGNLFTKFIDFEELGIKDIKVLGKLMSFGFVLSDAKFDCDCHMEPYLELAEPILKTIWRDYFNMSCWNPLEYRGLSIPNLVLEKKLDLLICNITEKCKCPRHCRCYYQPHKQTTIVNCTDVNLEFLPEYVPEASNLTLLFKNNKIKKIETRDYFANATFIDISGNGFNEVEKNVSIQIRNDIKFLMQDHNLHDIPRGFQLLNPCFAQIGRAEIKCECKHMWIKDWLHNKNAAKCENKTLVICVKDSGQIPMLSINRDDLCVTSIITYQTLSIILCVLSILMFVVSVILYYYRYEIYLLVRHIKSKSNKISVINKYDVYFSFDDDNPFLRYWVFNFLDLKLKQAGYRNFIPCRDTLPGAVHEENMINKITNSRNFLIILSKTYEDDDNIWMKLEWKYIWHHFYNNRDRRIVIINYDLIDRPVDLKLKAFIRLGLDVDFANRRHILMDEVKLRLGLPYCAQQIYIKNSKPKFISSKLSVFRQGEKYEENHKSKLAIISSSSVCLEEVI
ncbi:protein toll-like [Mytilus trossulus]|uniref:protein toll-like n=1 Tax=Mytilus trossulus TaxID=6551 RepID=UPI00300710C0